MRYNPKIVVAAFERPVQVGVGGETGVQHGTFTDDDLVSLNIVDGEARLDC